MKNTLLIIGGGGREHALAWKLAQSPEVGKIYVAPGNGGTADIAENVPVAATDVDGLVRFALEKKMDLTVVGPDDALALGVVDAFRGAGLAVFGPSRAAAEIEASKAFAKQLMRSRGIPTADFGTFIDKDPALEYARSLSSSGDSRIVVKASGLALGKGVVICANMAETEDALRQIFVERAFGDAGNEVVIEEFLEGQEVSMHAITDGHTFRMFPPAQDHKTIFDGDRGPNTGGMGTIAPVPWVTEETMRLAAEEIVVPALEGLRAAGGPFSGLLYPGLKMTPAAGPKVLEFNARFGDPETQSYMRLLKTDLFRILSACAAGTLDAVDIEWHAGFAACVILASGGYPGGYGKGKVITGIADAEKLPGVVVFHAGTGRRSGNIVTSGGRVLGVSATGGTLQQALDRAYAGVAKIDFEGMQYRKDIGARALRSL